MKLTFDQLAQEALTYGCRLERGAADRPYGMRTGFIVWTRRGTWVQVATLKEAAKQIRLGRMKAKPPTPPPAPLPPLGPPNYKGAMQ